MTVVVKVADDRDDNAALVEPLDDVRNGGRGLASVYRHSHELGTSAGELFDLLSGTFDVDGIGVGHRLNDDWVLPADSDPVYIDRY
jgi:hypothetical protein